MRSGEAFIESFAFRSCTRAARPVPRSSTSICNSGDDTPFHGRTDGAKSTQDVARQSAASSPGDRPIVAADRPDPGIAPETRAQEIAACASLLSENVCIVFDTETTGFRGSIIQLGFVVHDFCANSELAAFCSVWHPPEDERLDPRAVQVHGIDEKRIACDGVPPTPELEAFVSLCVCALSASAVLVAHNARFDMERLQHTCSANGVPLPFSLSDITCTMRASTVRCSLRAANGRTKPPKNSELHAHFFGHAPPDTSLHDALADARVTARCFVAGYHAGWW